MHELVLVPGAARAEEEQIALCERAGGVLLRPGALALGAFAARVLAAAGEGRAPARPWALQLAALDGPLGPDAAGPLAALHEEAVLAGLDPAHPPGGLGAAGAALAALARRLDRAQMLSPAAALPRAAEVLAEGKGAQALTGVTRVVVRGFLELSPAALALVRALSRHRPVLVEAVYDPERAPEWPLADRMLARLEAGWEQPGDLEVDVVAPARPATVRGLVVSGPGAMARTAAHLVREALEEGVPADGVAVVAPRPDQAAAVRRALLAAQVPVAGARATSQAETPAGRALLAALAGAASPDRRLVEELAAASGRSGSGLPRLLARAGAARGAPAELSLSLLALAARLPEGAERRRARETGALVAQLGASVAAIAGAGSLEAQLRAARSLFRQLGGDEAALDELLHVATSLGAAQPATPRALASVTAQVLGAPARRQPGPASGAVRVCAPADLVGRSFERVLIVGCEAGLARAGQTQGVVDEAAWAAAAGLALDRRRAEERSLFSAAAGAARGALVLLAAPVEGAEPHFAAEELLAVAGGVWEAAPVGMGAATEPAALFAAAVAESEANPVARAVLALGGAGALAGRARDVAARAAGEGGALGAEVARLVTERVERKGAWSASALEEYARCPFLFFARRGLGLGSDDAPSADPSPREEGSLLHRALRSLYEELASRKLLPLREKDLPAVRALSRRAAEAAFDEAMSTAQVGDVRAAPARREALARMVERLVAAEVAEGGEFVPAAFELGFDDLEAGGVRLRGSIDRVDLAPNGVRVVDYKRGSDPARRHAGLAELAGVEPGPAFQLPVYLAAAERWAAPRGVRAERRAAGYRMLESAEFIAAPEADGPAGAERLKRALDEGVAAVVAGVRAGRFPAAPREECMRCDQAPVCRYRGEMQEGA